MMGFAELIDCDHCCRFPLDEHHWCGAKTADGGSWCTEHRRRVFLAPERIPTHLRLEKRPATAADEVKATWLRMANAR